MFIVIIVIICVWVLIASNTPDKKDKEKVKEEIEKLPRILLKSKNLSGWEKFVNLAYDDSTILKSFLYDNGFVTLTMQSGAKLTASLSSMQVIFTKVNSLIEVTVSDRNSKIKFYEMAYLYSNQEWEVIYKVLSLANTTYGTDIFSNWNKNMGKVNSILKIIKYFS